MNHSSLIAVVATTLISACGGGGGSSAPLSNAANPTTFQSIATEGELVSYTVDTSSLTYSYNIVESAYGKAGATGSGQLTRNLDGTYTPSGFTGKIAVLESGLLLGAIHEDLNNDGTKEVVPVIGVSNPVNSSAEAADTYNFVSRQCSSGCTNYYGTIKVNADGTWQSCVGANLAVQGYSCQSSTTGGTTNLSAGRATLTFNGVNAGSMLVFKDAASNQKVMLLDLNGATNLGKGAIFGASQSMPASADGTWTYLHTNGTSGSVNVTGTNFTDAGKTASGVSYGPVTGSLTFNQPWNGLVTTSAGAVILPAGSGFYAGYFGTHSSMSVGLKK
jgi:hypothetical protein